MFFLRLNSRIRAVVDKDPTDLQNVCGCTETAVQGRCEKQGGRMSSPGGGVRAGLVSGK